MPDSKRTRPSKSRWKSAGAWHDGEYSGVTNLDLAIFCFMLHRAQLVILPLHRVVRLGYARHEVVFYDPDDVLSTLEMEFTNGGPQGAESRGTPREQATTWSKAYALAQRDLKTVMRSKDAGSGKGNSEQHRQPRSPADRPERRPPR